MRIVCGVPSNSIDVGRITIEQYNFIGKDVMLVMMMQARFCKSNPLISSGPGPVNGVYTPKLIRSAVKQLIVLALLASKCVALEPLIMRNGW